MRSVYRILFCGFVLAGACDAFAGNPVQLEWRRIGLPPGGREEINPEGDRQVFAVQFVPTKGRIYAANRFTGEGRGGLMVTDDGGATWRELGPPGNWSLKSGPNDGGFRIHPARPDWFFFGSENRGVFVSHDGGGNWQHVIRGWEEGGIGHGLPFAFDPRDERTVFASGGRGVFRSTDAGRTWTRLGLPETQTNWVAVSPRDGRIVYAAGTWKVGHLSRSDDGGENWTLAMSGFPQGRIGTSGYPLRATWQVVPDPRVPDRLYAATASGLFRSDDDSATWRLVYNSGVPGKTQNGMICIAVHPRNSAVLVGAESLGRVMLSTDAGVTWVEITGNLRTGAMPHRRFGIRTSELAFDPHDPQWIYAARSDGLYRARLP